MPLYPKETLENAKMEQLQGLGTKLPPGFSRRPSSLERISQVFPNRSQTLGSQNLWTAWQNSSSLVILFYRNLL